MAGIVSLAVRLRRSRGEMRQQLSCCWTSWPLLIAAELAIEVYGDMVDEMIFRLDLLPGAFNHLLGLPLVIGLAVFKYHYTMSKQ